MIKKQKKLVILAICLCAITLSVGWNTTQLSGRIIIDPTDPIEPVILTTPSATSVNEGDSIRITWTAYSFASQTSRTAYIYVDGNLVKSYSRWSNFQALYYDFSRDTAGTYSIRCTISDSYGSDSDTVSIEVIDVVQWTVMFYLDGDSDVVVNDGAIFKDSALKNIGSDDNVQFISLLDLSAATSKYCYYGANSLVTRIDQGELNMGAEETLEDFIDWGKANYPAHNYMVVLFDHGMGIMNRNSPHNIGGVCLDNDDYLTPIEIKNALSGENIDILGMDACLMGSTEILYTIQNEVDFYVASEDVEYAGIGDGMGITIIDDDGMSSGWPYETIFPWLKSNPTASAESLASKIVDKYEACWSRTYNVLVRMFDDETGRFVIEYIELIFDGTMSAIDTSYMISIASQFSSLTSNLYSYISSNIGDLYNIRARCNTYHVNHYIDLYDFLNKILDESALSTLHSEVQSLQSTISNAVINNAYFQSGMAFSHGMSLYFPAITGVFWSDYLNTQWNIETEWGNFLEIFFSTSVLPAISSPADQFIMAGSPCSITWSGNPKEAGSFNYVIYRGGSIVVSGTYSQGSTMTYSFTAPMIPLGHMVDYNYKCRIYNSWGYTEDVVTIHVVNI